MHIDYNVLLYSTLSLLILVCQPRKMLFLNTFFYILKWFFLSILFVVL